MKYRNKKTGQTIEFSSKIYSKEWEPVVERVPSFSVKETEEKVEVAPVQQKKSRKKAVD